MPVEIEALKELSRAGDDIIVVEFEERARRIHLVPSITLAATRANIKEFNIEKLQLVKAEKKKKKKKIRQEYEKKEKQVDVQKKM